MLTGCWGWSPFLHPFSLLVSPPPLTRRVACWSLGTPLHHRLKFFLLRRPDVMLGPEEGVTHDLFIKSPLIRCTSNGTPPAGCQWMSVAGGLPKHQTAFSTTRAGALSVTKYVHWLTGEGMHGTSGGADRPRRPLWWHYVHASSCTCTIREPWVAQSLLQ